MRWNLDAFYKGINDESYKRDFARLKEIIVKLNEKIADFENIHDKSAYLENIMIMLEEFTKLRSRLRSICTLTLSVDATNFEAKKANSDITVALRDFNSFDVDFIRCLSKIENLDEIISKSEILKEYEFIIKEGLKSAAYLLDKKTEEAIIRIKETGSKEWYDLQNKLTSLVSSNMKIGKSKQKMNLSSIRNMQYFNSKSIRKAAFKAEEKCYEKIRESSASALSSIKGEVINECELRGYKSPLEKTYIESRIDKDVVDAMWDAVKDYQHYFVKYFKKKAELLGYKKGLPYYELFAPVGESKMNMSFEEARDFVIEQYSSFSKELGDFARYAFENNWLDTEPREGKRGGAFCLSSCSINESRVLSNFSGSFDDMITFAHELGHAYHGRQIFKERILNQSYTMPIAETASIFAETIVYKKAIEKADKKDKLTILESSIQGSSQTIIDIYSRFLFEDRIFELRKDHPIGADEFDAVMQWAQKEAYKDGLDHSKLNKGMWICKLHYYSSSLNYYNFPYAFGLLFARGLYAKYKEEKEAFVDKYNIILRATGKMNIKDVCKLAGIDISDKNFFKKSLETIKEEIEEFLTIA